MVLTVYSNSHIKMANWEILCEVYFTAIKNKRTW
jgi:hypothetical protein